MRGEPHATALLAALADGRIDTIGSDHAPHMAGEKSRDYPVDALAGLNGVETSLPLFLTAVSEGRLSAGTTGGGDLGSTSESVGTAR